MMTKTNLVIAAALLAGMGTALAQSANPNLRSPTTANNSAWTQGHGTLRSAPVFLHPTDEHDASQRFGRSNPAPYDSAPLISGGGY
jgi:hypothetical protein